MKKIIISILIFMMLVIFLPINNVVALPTGWSLIDDFDDNCLIDDTSGGNAAYNWSRTAGDHFIIDGSEEPGGDKYLKVSDESSGDQTQDEGYFNATAVHNGYWIKFRGSVSATSVDSANKITCWYNFYNTSGNITVKLRTACDDYYWGSGSNDHTTDIHYQNSQGSWVRIYRAYRQSTFYTYYLSWQYYTDNILQYRVYDSSLNLLAITNATGLIGGDDYTGPDQFNSTNCTIVSVSDLTITEGYARYYIYEYGYISEELDLPDYFYPDLDLNSRCSNYNPSQGSSYSQIYEVDPLGCEPDWGCMIVNWFLAYTPDEIIDMCVDCNWDQNPVQYIEHKTEGFYNETIRHVLLPISNDQVLLVSDEPTDYELIIDDTYIGAADYIVPYDIYYGIVWENVNVSVDGQIVFGFYSSQHTEGFAEDWYWYGVSGFAGGWGDTRVHNDVFKFYDGQITGTYMGNWKATVCWYYDNASAMDDAEPYKLPTIFEFDDIFGSGDTGVGYVEWIGWQTECYYQIGLRTVPQIVYNLTGYGPGNGTKSYYFAIYKITTGTDEIVYNGFIEVINRNWSRNIRTLSDMNDGSGFTSSGQYYIMVYNMTSPSVLNEFAHQSMTITVCPTAGEPPGGDVYDIFPFLGQPLGSIVGLIFTIFMILVPFILQGMFQLSSIHPIVYMLTGGLGLSISVILGWFPTWLPFFIIAIGIIIIVFTYLYQQKQSSGG